MQSDSNEIGRYLPSLRRYARSLIGSQERGDRCVRVSLETLLADPSLLTSEAPVRLGLYRLFHDVWNRVPTGLPDSSDQPESAPTRGIEAHMQQLPAREREVLLLTTVEGFSLEDAAEILRIDI